jgi:hypothetical protein
MPPTDKHSPDSALRALQRIGVRPDERDSSLNSLPYRGPGIKEHAHLRAMAFATHPYTTAPADAVPTPSPRAATNAPA